MNQTHFVFMCREQLIDSVDKEGQGQDVDAKWATLTLGKIEISCKHCSWVLTLTLTLTLGKWTGFEDHWNGLSGKNTIDIEIVKKETSCRLLVSAVASVMPRDWHCVEKLCSRTVRQEWFWKEWKVEMSKSSQIYSHKARTVGLKWNRWQCCEQWQLRQHRKHRKQFKSKKNGFASVEQWDLKS